VAFVENYHSDEEESTKSFRDNSMFEDDLEQAVSSLNQIGWHPPVFSSENYGKVRFEANWMTNGPDALRGRRQEMHLEQLDDSCIDVDQQENPAEKIHKSYQIKMKVLVKEDKRQEAILANELENIKIQTTFSQLTALSPVYAQEIVKFLSKNLADTTHSKGQNVSLRLCLGDIQTKENSDDKEMMHNIKSHKLKEICEEQGSVINTAHSASLLVEVGGTGGLPESQATELLSEGLG
ncbi:hypothetical protein VP01_4501g1, partial [Puccinia sorghi]